MSRQLVSVPMPLVSVVLILGTLVAHSARAQRGGSDSVVRADPVRRMRKVVAAVAATTTGVTWCGVEQEALAFAVAQCLDADASDAGGFADGQALGGHVHGHDGKQGGSHGLHGEFCSALQVKSTDRLTEGVTTGVGPRSFLVYENPPTEGTTMKIVVIGGTGLIGSKLIGRLQEHGHEGVAAAPNTGVNTLTGEGLAEALVGADVVVDVSNSPSFADDDVLDFFTRSTSNLLAAEKVAGVRHHVALSIVGTDRLPTSGYLRAKVAQEQLIRDGGVPYSIVHATQFYEFTDAIAQAATVGDEVHLSTGYFQPMAADDVVAALGPVVVGAPLGGIQEIGGPVKTRMSDFVAAALARKGDPRTVVADPGALYFGAVLEGEELVPGPGAHLSATTYDDWATAQSASVG